MFRTVSVGIAWQGYRPGEQAWRGSYYEVSKLANYYCEVDDDVDDAFGFDIRCLRGVRDYSGPSIRYLGVSWVPELYDGIF